MTIDEIKLALHEAKTAYLALANDKPAVSQAAAAKVKAMQSALNAAITAGAKPCKCGAPAMGIEQPIAVGGSAVLTMYELGCSGTCKNPTDKKERVKLMRSTPVEAVAVWNARQAK